MVKMMYFKLTVSSRQVRATRIVPARANVNSANAMCAPEL